MSETAGEMLLSSEGSSSGVADSSLILPPSSFTPIPLPKIDITIRPGTMEDIAFLDSLQKKTTKQVGWMPTKQFEGKIKAGHVLIAVGATHASPANVGARDPGDACVAPTEERVGYLIGNDQYFKRDDVGIIYQINVIPEMRRSLVAASLLKAQFERSAYGCRLYCCWCAQDIEANHFWESMGFVPLAFRAGGKVKVKRDVETERRRDEVEDNSSHFVSSSPRLSVSSARVHIFWQKRIRSGDTTTPWWFPSKTAGGSIREDRIVLPIPPGTHWSDAKPLILPVAGELPVVSCQLPEKVKKPLKPKSLLATGNSQLATPPPIRRNGLLFDIPKQGEPLPEAKPLKVATPKAAKVKRTCDPRLVAAARELKDRWLEQVNAQPVVVVGKYDVTRVIEGRVVDSTKRLAA